MRTRTTSLITTCLAMASVVVGLTLGAGTGAATTESTFPLADPDTVLAPDGSYVTYGTTVRAGVGARCGGIGRLNVPVLRHGSGNTVGMANCASGDAMPDGVGDWAEGDVWAPGVVEFGDRYFLYYTASKKGTSQKCIGRAVSDSAGGPFRNAREWACPGGGRWAIDASPFVANGRMYVIYRDDAITSFPETGISVVRTDENGFGEWSTRRDILKSTDITWDTRSATGTANIIENPSMFRRSDGNWYVMYSGNNWESVRYSTGILNCGTSPLPATRCEPLRDGANRPYFGYRGDGGINPYRTLPGNNTGPGGMEVFEAADGSQRVVYHWWRSGSGPRYPITGVLDRDSDGFLVS